MGTRLPGSSFADDKWICIVTAAFLLGLTLKGTVPLGLLMFPLWSGQKARIMYHLSFWLFQQPLQVLDLGEPYRVDVYMYNTN